MCGLVGLAGDCTLKMKDVFTDMLYIDTLRGGHSTGTALVKREKSEVIMEKAPMPGTSFVYTEPYKKLMDNIGVKTFLGHNRFATIGAKTADNAHPFAFEGVVGAHNGTIDKFALSELENADKFGTDSEAIYNSINKIGVKATVAKLTGAWALTFVDLIDDTMNLLRNNKRPLFYAYTETLETLLWASEAEMLIWAVNRHNFKLKDGAIMECEPDTHYRWKLPEKLGDKFTKPTVSKVEGYKWTYNSHASFQQQNWKDNRDLWLEGVDEDGYSYSGYVATPYVPKKPDPKPIAQVLEEHRAKNLTKKHGGAKINTAKFRPPYKDAEGKVMNKKTFFSLVQTGCVYCDDVNKKDLYKWGDFIHPLQDDMDSRKIFLCEPCYNDDEVRELVESSIV